MVYKGYCTSVQRFVPSHLKYQWVVQVLREILCLSNGDEEKLGLYRDAYGLLRDLPAGSFPPKEVTWLVATSFNRGCQHAKFCRQESAVAFMAAAIQLLQFCPDLEGKREVNCSLAHGENE